MAGRVDLKEWAREQVDSPLPHFWPDGAVLEIFERRIHGQSLPRANRAEAGTTADFWLTEVGVVLFEYLMGRVQDTPRGVLIKCGVYQEKKLWWELAHHDKSFFSPSLTLAMFPRRKIEFAVGDHYKSYVLMVHQSRNMRTWAMIMTFLDPADYEQLGPPPPGHHYGDRASMGSWHQPSPQSIRQTMGQVMSMQAVVSMKAAQQYEYDASPTKVTPETSRAQESLTGYPWPGGRGDVKTTVAAIQSCMGAPTNEKSIHTLIRAKMVAEKSSQWYWPPTNTPSSSSSSSACSRKSRRVADVEELSDHEHGSVPFYVRAPHLPAHRLRNKKKQ